MGLFIKRIIRSVAIRVLLAREWLDTRVTFNPTSRRFIMDPYPTYTRLQKKDPVHWSRLIKCWIVSTHRDVDAVLRDYKRFANDVRNAKDQLAEEQLNEVHSMLYLDPPDHTRLRSLVSQAFTRGAIEAMYPRIEQIVDDLLDQVNDGQPFDAMETLAYPLPIIVISEMLGVPPEDRERFREWSDDLAGSLEPGLSAEEFRLINQSLEALTNYFDGIIMERRAEPRDDLISALNAAEEGGEKLTHQELLMTLTLLLVAGNETTKNLIGNGLYALLQHPEQLARLRLKPELIPSAVEELLRYDSPVQMDTRTALEDLAIGSKQIKKGQEVVLLIGSANRDADAFHDPDNLVIDREEYNHMSFGRGIHHCLGAQLAQVEGEVALRKLVGRYPHIGLAGKPRHNDRVVLRGLQSLPIATEEGQSPVHCTSAVP